MTISVKNSDEIYTLYKQDNDFKEYVDKWCKKHDLSIFEAFRMKIVQGYAERLIKEREGKI